MKTIEKENIGILPTQKSKTTTIYVEMLPNVRGNHKLRKIQQKE